MRLTGFSVYAIIITGFSVVVNSFYALFNSFFCFSFCVPFLCNFATVATLPGVGDIEQERTGGGSVSAPERIKKALLLGSRVIKVNNNCIFPKSVYKRAIYKGLY